jgi:protein tyrosine/serine phosphatase
MRLDALVNVIRPGDPPLYPPYRGWARVRAWLAMLFADHGIFRTFFNTRKPISEEMWRSSQPLPYQIRSAAKAGIRTIVNLRGPSDSAFYRLEEEACQKAGITLVNFVVYSREAPLATTVAAADTLFRTIDYPALMHCKSGADRAGLMGVLYLHFRKGEPIDKAMRMLNWRYGHVRQGKTGVLDYFFERYLAEGAPKGLSLIDWTEQHYDRKVLKQEFRTQAWANVLVDKILRRE